MDIFLIAWELLLERIKAKTSWGNVELQKVMLQCFIDAGKKKEEKEQVAKEATIGLTLTCPYCGSDKTYFSAYYQAWKCTEENCGRTFTLEDAKKEGKDNG